MKSTKLVIGILKVKGKRLTQLNMTVVQIGVNWKENFSCNYVQ